MRRRMMKSKIHCATVTGADLHYEGSISVDPALMAAADIRESEQVHVLDIDNGVRLETYAISGSPGEVRINGAAARLIQLGDTVIILTYTDYEGTELADFQAAVVQVDSLNRQVTEHVTQKRPPKSKPASEHSQKVECSDESRGVNASRA